MYCGNLLVFSDDTSPFTSMFLPAFLALFLFASPLIVETPTKYNELELTFPITRKDIVCSKYIEIAALTFVIMILAFIIYLRSNNSSAEEEIFFVFDRFDYFPVVPCIVLILHSVVTPLAFRFGLVGALPLLIAPIVSPALIIPIFTISDIENDYNLFSNFPIILLIVAIAVYVASFFVSLRIMKKGRQY
jgi:hypothetical protein